MTCEDDLYKNLPYMNYYYNNAQDRPTDEIIFPQNPFVTSLRNSGRASRGGLSKLHS